MSSPDALEVRLFPDAAAFDAWLDEHGGSSPGVHLQLAKKGAAVATVGYADAVEVALCHGWVDGQANSVDAETYLVRFTPRRPKSLWSAKNVQTVTRLTEAGRMRPAGLAAVAAARADGRWERAYAGPADATVPDDLAAALDAVPAAREAFDALTRSGRYSVLFAVHTAGTPQTRARRIEAAVRQLTPSGEVQDDDGQDRGS